LKCFTCPFQRPSPYSPVSNVPDMDPEFFRRIIQEYSGATMVGIVGGEPLLHPYVIDFLTIARSSRMNVNISTNGLLLDESMTNRLLDAAPNFVNISLDAASPDEYLRMRGGSEKIYTTILNNARRFAELRSASKSETLLLLSFVTDQHNIEKISAFANLAKDIGADQVFCQNILSYECSHLTDKTSPLMDIQENRDRLSNLDLPEGITVTLPALIPLDDDCSCVRCHHPFKMLTFDGGGNLSPCCVIPPHPQYGNLNDDVRFWRNGSKMLEIRQNMLDGADAFADICLYCWDRFSLGQHEEVQ